MAAVSTEVTERKNAVTAVETSRALEISQRTAADTVITQGLASAVQNLFQADAESGGCHRQSQPGAYISNQWT